MLYFILNDLNAINPIYQFSLKAFSVVFQNAILRAEFVGDETVTERVNKLIDAITFCVFQYTTRYIFNTNEIMEWLIINVRFQLGVCLNATNLYFRRKWPSRLVLRKQKQEPIKNIHAVEQILLISEEITMLELDFLLRFPVKPHVTSPVDFISNYAWGGE